MTSDASAAPLVPAAPPRVTTGLQQLWPAPTTALTHPGLDLVVAAAVVGALAVPGPVGLGLAATGVLVLAAALPSLRRRGTTPTSTACMAVAAALLLVPAVRDAGWVVALCVLAAVAVSVAGVTGGRTWSGVVAGWVAAPLAALRALPWAARTARVPSGGAGWRGLLRGVRVAGVSLLLLTVFGALFAGADALFGTVVERSVRAVLPAVDLGLLPVRVTFGAMVAALGLGAAFLAAAPVRGDVLAPGPGRPARRVDWLVPLVLLDLLFGAFVVLQGAVLLRGHETVLATAGLTYAEYARQGFAQLLVVTALTLLVMAVAARRAPRTTRTDRVLARVVLGALGVLTLLVVVSALRRLALYEEAFGFTRARLAATTAELWLGLVVVLVLVAGIRWSGSWLPRAVVLSGGAAVLALAALNPDAYVAQRNVERLAATGEIDVAYLSLLSADAWPALQGLSDLERSCLSGPVVSTSDPLPGWNLGRERARQLPRIRPALATYPRCQPVLWGPAGG